MPQVLVNARVNNAKKNTYMEVPAIRHAIANWKKNFPQTVVCSSVLPVQNLLSVL